MAKKIYKNEDAFKESRFNDGKHTRKNKGRNDVSSEKNFKNNLKRDYVQHLRQIWCISERKVQDLEGCADVYLCNDEV